GANRPSHLRLALDPGDRRAPAVERSEANRLLQPFVDQQQQKHIAPVVMKVGRPEDVVTPRLDLLGAVGVILLHRDRLWALVGHRSGWLLHLPSPVRERSRRRLRRSTRQNGRNARTPPMIRSP